jgi:hypothetical protein
VSFGSVQHEAAAAVPLAARLLPAADSSRSGAGECQADHRSALPGCPVPRRRGRYRLHKLSTPHWPATLQAEPSQQQLQYTVSEAQSAAELRAAAYLRAYSFYSYPADRNAYAARVRSADPPALWCCPGCLSACVATHGSHTSCPQASSASPTGCSSCRLLYKNSSAAVQNHRRMKADAEWEALTKKVEGAKQLLAE